MNKVKLEKMWLSTVLKLLDNPEAEMVLFAAYINDGLCYEYFCQSVPPEIFYILSAGIEATDYFREAVKDSGIIGKGVQRFIGVAFSEFNMWYHFLNGTDTILADAELTKFLPVQDRNLARSLFALWNEGKLDEENWDSYIGKAGLLEVSEEFGG